MNTSVFDMDQEKIFATQPKNVVKPKNSTDAEILESAQESVGNKPTTDYVPVKLDSIGKLSSPAILHFRNYTMEEALRLAEANEENIAETIIQCLNEMVWEDFDCGLLHVEELKEVMLYIYGSFWDTKLEGFRYFVNEELEEPALSAKENVSIATIPISSIKTTPLPEEFKEPISITMQGKTVKFLLPRIQNSFVAQEFIKQKYAADLRKFSNLEGILRYNESVPSEKHKNVDTDEYNNYRQFVSKKSKDLVRAYEAQLLYGVDDYVFEEIADRMEALKSIPLSYWKIYHKVVEENCRFGVEEEVAFECSVTHKPVTRRFQFRLLDFIPSLDNEFGTEYSFSFG